MVVVEKKMELRRKPADDEEFDGNAIEPYEEDVPDILFCNK